MPDSPENHTERKRRRPLWILAALLVAGAVLFAGWTWRTSPHDPNDPASRSIHLTRHDQARLTAGFAEVAGRPPTPAERSTLVDRWVREEVLYREALRLGLDRDDPLVRKRLAQTMEDSAVRASAARSPDDATLQAWLQAHPDRFSQDLKLTFDQIFFTSRSRAVVGHTLLAGGATWTRLGDPVSLPDHFEAANRQAVADTLGADFARELGGMVPATAWHGPVESALGWHLVRLTAKQPGEVPPLAAIRTQVAGNWRAANSRQQRDAAYQALRRRYRITIDR